MQKERHGIVFKWLLAALETVSAALMSPAELLERNVTEHSLTPVTQEHNYIMFKFFTAVNNNRDIINNINETWISSRIWIKDSFKID